MIVTEMAYTAMFGWLVLLLGATFSSAERGMMCKDHPLYKQNPSIKSEIIRSWKYKGRKKELRWHASYYMPRYKNHVYSPQEKFNCKKYADLDLFVTNMDRNPARDSVTLHFQRPAKVYLLVGARGRNKNAKLSGWKPEGWARLVQGAGKPANFGLKRKMQFHFPGSVYVFSQTLKGTEAQIPNIKWVQRHMQGLRASWFLGVLVAEVDGKPVRQPYNPLGVNIHAGGRCPDDLHNEWKILGRDKDDPHINDIYFKTFHPLWDPCYWCAYDHEHGSDTVSLMGYHPRFGYAALKNYKQNESHKGFKGIVFRVGDNFVYFQVHAHISGPGRFTVRHHTVVIVVTNAITSEVLVELAYKADYGFASTRPKRGGLMAVTPADSRLQKLLRKQHSFATRQMNFINLKKRNPKYRYRKQVLQGFNEHWFTQPMCSKCSRAGVKMEFRNPSTGSRIPGSSKGSDMVKLGSYVKLNHRSKAMFAQHASNNRDLTTQGWTISDSLCIFKLSNIRGIVKKGYFYTDPMGHILLAGAEPYAIRQYIKPGFKLSMKGKYRATDTWLGLHQNGAKGFMRNVGYAIDPATN